MTAIVPLIVTFCVAASTSLTVGEFKARPIPEYVKHLKGQDLVDYINNNQPFYKAKLPKMSMEQFKSRLMDVKYLKQRKETGRAKHLVVNEEIPEKFDAREKWPNCKSISLIRDQANCGSCWAVSAASVMSDRICTQTNGKNNTIASDTDILACCGEYCGEG
ncbi:unnamed protein product [Cylicocyclus nassatus]|uniref:Peptidase C1A papain C-terminal domain-containing protein n=1 Tax=Cylicocyclus nassatus TaxID=53992 RepID=A0AA36GMF4_CYLNA|nr:unnamed protein product [Cylicocyclus nassatus]